MKLTFKHTALSLALAGSFTLTGCNFIGSGDPVFVEPTPTTPPTQQSVALSGTATKGSLIGATVYGCVAKTDCSGKEDLTNGLAGEEGFVGETTTGADGSYSLEVNSNGHGKVIVVRIVANESTTMECDLADQADCDNLDLTGTELKTIALAPTPSDTAPTVTLDTVEVSVLSTLTTELLQDAPELNDSLTQDELKNLGVNNSQAVALMLGIEDDIDVTTDFLTLEIPSATPDKIAATSDTKVKNLALVNASFGKLAEQTKTLGKALKDIAKSVKKVVGDPESTNDEDVTVLANLADKVKTEVTANANKVNVTKPKTKEPASVTLTNVKADANKAKVSKGKGTQTPTPVTGASGGSGAANDNG
ncbi:hypothetical protein [Catenovulum sediminis]|uniref:hypothetical protein n=1 Tax=Catenovulum sediminis TaxID=1740262 RepID=UPI001181443F|nr:hypothetical protein [Catenovulum sediminis]